MQFKARARKQIYNFQPYTPGLSPAEIKQKTGLQEVIKMASNENPLGVSTAVQETLRSQARAVSLYPRPGSPELCQKLSARYNLPQDCFFIGNGSDEIIDLLFRVLAEPGLNNVVLLDPCFSIYQSQAYLFGLETRKVALNHDFSFPWTNILQSIDADTALVFITNPDNPSGYAVQASELAEFASSLPDHCVLVVDEAYVEFASDPEAFSASSLWHSLSNTVILRTFSKIYGLAGLRLGYAIMPPTLTDFLQRIRLPFSVNILAEQAGLAALADHEFYKQTRETVLQGRSYLKRALEDLGCQVYPSQANFLLFKPPLVADLVFESLLHKGIILRTLHSYGLADYLRVSIGRRQENEKLIAHLAEIVNR